MIHISCTEFSFTQLMEIGLKNNVPAKAYSKRLLRRIQHMGKKPARETKIDYINTLFSKFQDIQFIGMVTYLMF